MNPVVSNLLSALPASSGEEQIETLIQTARLRIERIVSNHQASPNGFWYDQPDQEWVALLQGTATLQFDGGEVVNLKAGDYLLIPAHQRHRVDRVSDDAVWLAVHFK